MKRATLSAATVEKRILRVRALIRKARFTEAFALCKKLHKKYPNHFGVTSRYATMMADSAEALPRGRRIRRKQKACLLLKKLLKFKVGDSEGNVTLKEYFWVRNELYFHSGQWLKQAQLGLRFQKRLPETTYSVCVGFAWHAAKVYCSGHDRRAKRYARKALAAGPKALHIHDNFYNLYVHLALAAGIARGIQATEKLLEKARKFSGRPKSHFEFEEVREILANRELRDSY